MIEIASNKFERLLLNTIPPGSNVLYFGCSDKSILNKLKPKYGVGIDTNINLIDQARKKYPHLIFENRNVLDIHFKERFNFVVLDDFLPYITDVVLILKRIRSLCEEDAKLIISSVPTMTLLTSFFGLFKRKTRKLRNWIPKQLLDTLLYISNFWPRPAIDSCIIADATEIKSKIEYSYSIIIPAYNEEGNIAECIRRIPHFKRDYEIIVVDDCSKDRTEAIVREIIKENKRVKLISYKTNMGKGYATKVGLDAATKDILMILDADMTVKPEDLPLFTEPFESRSAEFVNGTRMVYRMENEAMKLMHLFGNKMFSIIFSYILNQKVTDTLCGTKCMFRKDYKRIKMKDNAWPDFDLLFGAARLNLKIVEIPVNYHKRVAGESKMRFIKHGFMLLKASIKGFFKLKLNISVD